MSIHGTINQKLYPDDEVIIDSVLGKMLLTHGACLTTNSKFHNLIWSQADRCSNFVIRCNDREPNTINDLIDRMRNAVWVLYD